MSLQGADEGRGEMNLSMDGRLLLEMVLAVNTHQLGGRSSMVWLCE